MIYNVVLPGYVSDTLNADSIVFGFSDMAYGVGGLASGFIAAAFARKFSKNKAISSIFILAVLTLLIISLNQLVILIYIGSFLIGFSNSSLRIIMNTMLMEIVPKALMGRALSVWMGIALLLQAIFATVMGVLIDMFSPSIGFLCMSGLMATGLLIHLLITKDTNKISLKKEAI